MAGEVSEFRRSSTPKFIDTETEFVGRGIVKPRSRSKSGNRLVNTLSVSDDSFYKDLEDYVQEMSSSRDTTIEGDDVWTQLQQKESDLLLAAELGKALLEKNEELKKEQEKAAEEFSKKLETGPKLVKRVCRYDDSETDPASAPHCLVGYCPRIDFGIINKEHEKELNISIMHIEIT
ncbi:unnamed protein product [Colias eurytheme]|nr:unnamed protein product [Colias eurytheme]